MAFIAPLIEGVGAAGAAEAGAAALGATEIGAAAGTSATSGGAPGMLANLGGQFAAAKAHPALAAADLALKGVHGAFFGSYQPKFEETDTTTPGYVE